MVQSLDPATEKAAKISPLVPAVDRAARILEILKGRREGYGVAEIARILNASKGTVSEILVTLERHKLVRRNEDTKKYSLGYAMIEYGQLVLQSIDLRQVVHPYVLALRDLTGESVTVSILDGDSTLVIDRVVSDTRLHVNVVIGQHHPAVVGSMSKLLLAYLEEDEVDAILNSANLPKFTERSIVDKVAFKKALHEVREMGYAVNDGEMVEGLLGVSAPIRDHHGDVIAALSVSCSKLGLTEERMLELVTQTKEFANRISADLGAPSP